MKKKLMISLLAVVIAVAGSVAIYAGVVGFDNEPNYIATEAVLGCCPVDVDLISPHDDWANGGGSGHACRCSSNRACGSIPGWASNCAWNVINGNGCPC
jgi:hypothetical protein